MFCVHARHTARPGSSGFSFCCQPSRSHL
jgi:hypothetical protein